MSDHQIDVPVKLPKKVAGKVDELRLGNLIAALKHPNRRMHAIFWWSGFLVFFVPIAISPFVSTADAGRTAVNVVIFGLISVPFAFMAIGAVTRQGFYLFEQGIVVTRSSGMVRFASTWRDVDGVYAELYQFQLIILFWALPRRYNCSIVTRTGKRIKYYEVQGKVAVTPIAQALHEAAS
ncbi:hypothetical protein [Actinokineospora sp. HUAS TT18]|uniref:hypothetical protein n=1 Tax=Actinokineospora sp. HUAS TT18 TaxID=3447451 RepID=UPI003F52433C